MASGNDQVRSTQVRSTQDRSGQDRLGLKARLSPRTSPGLTSIARPGPRCAHCPRPSPSKWALIWRLPGMLIDDDPEAARVHADEARRLAGRVATCVRQVR